MNVKVGRYVAEPWWKYGECKRMYLLKEQEVKPDPEA